MNKTVKLNSTPTTIIMCYQIKKTFHIHFINIISTKSSQVVIKISMRMILRRTTISSKTNNRMTRALAVTRIKMTIPQAHHHQVTQMIMIMTTIQILTQDQIIDLIMEMIINKMKMTYKNQWCNTCLLYTSPSPRDRQKSRMPSSA